MKTRAMEALKQFASSGMKPYANCFEVIGPLHDAPNQDLRHREKCGRHEPDAGAVRVKGVVRELTLEQALQTPSFWLTRNAEVIPACRLTISPEGLIKPVIGEGRVEYALEGNAFRPVKKSGTEETWKIKTTGRGVGIATRTKEKK